MAKITKGPRGRLRIRKRDLSYRSFFFLVFEGGVFQHSILYMLSVLQHVTPLCVFSVELLKLSPYVSGENSEAIIKLNKDIRGVAQSDRWTPSILCCAAGDGKKEAIATLHFSCLMSKS